MIEYPSSEARVPDAIPITDGQTPVCAIPAALRARFRGRPVIPRTTDPAELPARFGPRPPADLLHVQIEGLGTDPAPLTDWGDGVPLELLMRDPLSELPLLYRWAGLLARHSVRVTIPLRPGLARAVKLAMALGFAVRLHGHQPGPEAITEARQAHAGYLHKPTVAQPAEPFHGLLVSFLHDTPVLLWSLLERHRRLRPAADPQPGPGAGGRHRDRGDSGAERRDPRPRRRRLLRPFCGDAGHPQFPGQHPLSRRQRDRGKKLNWRWTTPR